jgi:hypothetical protein
MRRRPSPLAWGIPLLLAAMAAGDDLDGHLDHDAFVRAIGEQGLGAILAALERAEPAADAIESRRRRIAAARLPLLDPGRTPRSVAEAAEQAVTLREELLASVAPEDPRRLRWLADQLEDLHRWLIPAEAADLAIRLGVFSPQQLAFAREWAIRGEAWSREAEALLERAADAELSRMPEEPAERRRRQRLLEEARGRVPLLRGLSAARAAELLPEHPDAPQWRRLAVDRLASAAIPENPDLAEIATLQLAIARIGLGQHEPAERSLEALAANASASPRHRFEAEAGLVLSLALRPDLAAARRLLEERRRRQRSMEEGVPFLPLWADLEHRLLRWDAARSEPAVGSAAWVAWLAPWLDLAEQAPPARRPAATAAAIARVREFLESSRLATAATLEALPPHPPPLLLAAAAEAILRREAGPDRDEALAAAVSALERSAANRAIAEELRTLLLRTLARVELARGRSAAAIVALLDAARSAPDGPDAAASLEAAVAIASAAARRERETSGLPRETLRDAIAIGRSHPRRDAWRIELAAAESQAGEFAAADRLLGEIPAASDLARHAAVAALENAVRAAEGAPPEESPRWLDRAEQLLQRLGPWPALPPSGSDPRPHQQAGARVALARGRLHLIADRPAAAIVEIATLRESFPLDPAGEFEAIRIRLSALDRLGREEEAAAELQAIAADGADGPLRQLLEARLAESIELAAGAERRGDSERSRRLGRESVGPLASTLRRALGSEPGAAAASVLLMIAEGIRRGGDPVEALVLAESLPPHARDSREGIRLRAECRFARGRLEDLAEAMPLYRRLAAGSPPHSDAWWLAELRILEILDRVGRDTDRIAPRIARLRAIDPDLGGEGHRRAFEALLLRR